MSFYLQHSGDFSDSLKKTLQTEGNSALKLFQCSTEKNQHEVIHENRKSFKKIRAGLRLIRDESDFYKKENIFYRDLGRELSDIRDRTSIIEAFDLLLHQFDNELNYTAFKSIRQVLLNDRKKHTEKLDLETKFKKISESLEEGLKRINTWKLSVSNYEKLRPSVKRVYKRGKKECVKNLLETTSKNRHEWRKRIKYLRYILDLINHIRPNYLKTLEDELHTLSDLLGTERDLYMLKQELNDKKIIEESELLSLNSIIESYRHQLSDFAILRGKKLYVNKAKYFNNSLSVAWEAHSEEEEKQISIDEIDY